MPSFLTPLLRDPGKHYILFNTRTRQIVASTLLTAFDSKSRNRGLLGRDSLAPGAAMIIAPSNAVHTFFMKFPIDVVFVAKHGVVLKIRTSLKPWRVAGARRAWAVIEMPGGAAAAAGLTAGDTIQLERS